MKILLLSATTLEIAPFLDQQKKENGSPVDILIAGVGTASTVYELLKQLPVSRYDLVIQAGIAGSFDDSLPLATTLLVKEDCFADLGMEEKAGFQTIFQSGLAAADQFPFSNGWLTNPNPFLQKTSLPVMRAISVNKISDSEPLKKQWMDTYQAQVESMEGAAFHYTCLRENIPFLQLRAISNYVGERNKANWKMSEAISNLNKSLQEIVETLNIEH